MKGLPGGQASLPDQPSAPEIFTMRFSRPAAATLLVAAAG